MSSNDFTFEAACHESELSDRTAYCVKIGPKHKAVLICRNEGRLYAIEPWCSHASQELQSGTVRNGWILCPAHGARFDLATGEALSPPAKKNIEIYPLRIRNGIVEVGIPS